MFTAAPEYLQSLEKTSRNTRDNEEERRTCTQRCKAHLWDLLVVSVEVLVQSLSLFSLSLLFFFFSPSSAYSQSVVAVWQSFSLLCAVSVVAARQSFSLLCAVSVVAVWQSFSLLCAGCQILAMWQSGVLSSAYNVSYVSYC